MNIEFGLRRFVFIVLLLLMWANLRAAGISGDSIVIGPGVDSVEMQTSENVLPMGDTVIMTEKVIRAPHSPHKATIMAMVLPGSGQIYNGQWWKVPILYGGVGATTYGIIWNNRRFKEYQQAFISYSSFLDGKNSEYYKDPVWQDIPTPYPVNEWPQIQDERGKTWFKTTLQNKKTNFKRNRDLCYIVMGAIYALNIIDACVFAHFYDFEIDDNLSMNILPTSSFSPVCGGTVGLCLTFNF